MKPAERGDYQEVKGNGVTFKVYGASDFPFVDAEIDPNSFVLSEPGAMISVHSGDLGAGGVSFTATMGNGEEQSMMDKLKSAGSRMMTSEDVFCAKWQNETTQSKTVQFGTRRPGRLVALRLADYGGSIICGSGAFYLGSSDISMHMCFKQSMGAMFFGDSFILQKIQSSSGHGVVCVQGGGTVMKEELNEDRPCIKLDTGALLCFTEGLKYDVTMTGGLKTMLFGGEGMFMCRLRIDPQNGVTQGTVWVESYPWSDFLGHIKSRYSH